MTKEVELNLKDLESQEQKILSLAKEMHQDVTYPLDLIANTIMDRSLQLIFAFTGLIRDYKYVAACHLVRCHLDNLLRFSGAWLVNDPHQFAIDVIGGKRIDKIKDRDGEFLKDWYLRNKLSEEFSWIEKVYKETSGFIHLSNKHFFSSTQVVENSNDQIEFKIGKNDYYINDELRIEAIKGMDKITEIICSYIEGWIATKKNKASFPQNNTGIT